MGRKLAIGRFGVELIELENATILLIYEGVPRLGTLALATPGPSGPTSSILTPVMPGQELVGLIAESIAVDTGRPALVSMSVKSRPGSEELREVIEEIRRIIASRPP